LYPTNLKYSSEHEWVKVEGGTATIGITDYAQNELGDIVYIELPKAGTKFNAMQEFGVVESVKTVSTLYCPVSGDIIDVNNSLSSKPEIINNDPHGKGWMIKVKMANPSDLDRLLSASDYEALIKK